MNKVVTAEEIDNAVRKISGKVSLIDLNSLYFLKCEKREVNK